MDQQKNDAAATRQRLQRRLAAISQRAAELSTVITGDAPARSLARLDHRLYQVGVELDRQLEDVEAETGTPVPSLAGFDSAVCEPPF